MIYDQNHRVTLPATVPPGLGEAIQAAGRRIENNNGLWYADDATAVQALIDGYSLADAKAFVVNAVIGYAKTVFDRAIASISAGEMAGWPILRAEALAYSASGNESDCPSIAQEAEVRGITVAALVAKVLANAAYFNALRAQISGVSGKHRDAINALATIADVASYDYTTGWPA